MSKEITASGKMSVGRFEKEFEKVYHVRIEIKVGKSLADNNATIASLRSKVKKNILKTFGITADLYHGGRIAPDDITLSDLRNGNVKKNVNKQVADKNRQEVKENRNMKNYTYICAYDNENNTDDFAIKSSRVVRTNGEYTLVFELETDGDGVVDSYTFYDVKSKARCTSESPWNFEEFMDEEEEYTNHESLEDFGCSSSDIADEFVNMKDDFVKKHLNNESHENLLSAAAVPFSNKNLFTVDDNGDLILEEGDKNIVPPMVY